MSYLDTSQPREITSFTAFGVPSLADVILVVQEADALAPRECESLASAVRTTARVVGLPAADTPASPAFLQRRLADVSPAAHGFSKGHWSNTCSRLMAALKIAGVLTVPGRRLAPLSPAW